MQITPAGARAPFRSGLTGVLACAVAVAAVSASPVAAAQTPAQGRRPLPPLPVTRLDAGADTGDLDSPRHLSIAFSQPIAIRDALLLLVRGTPFSIAFDPETRGTFLGDLKDVTLRQALESVLLPRGLAYSVEGTLIRVFPRRTESRFFDVNFVNVRRAFQRTLTAADGSLTTVTASDPFDDVEKSVAGMLSKDGRVHVDRRAGLVSVTDYPDRLDRVALYLEALQVRSLRQVRLQARIVDSRAGTTLPLPEMLTVNNEPVVMRSAASGGPSLALTVVPQIAADGIIQLSVSPSWAEGTGRAGGSDVIARVRNGGTLTVPVAGDLVVQVTATLAGPPSGGE